MMGVGRLAVITNSHIHYVVVVFTSCCCCAATLSTTRLTLRPFVRWKRSCATLDMTLSKNRSWRWRQPCLSSSIRCVRHSVCDVAHTHTHPFIGPFSRTTQVGRYQKGKTNLDLTEARDCEWQWHQLGHTQVCTSLQTDNHASTSPLSFLQAGCPSCCPTNSVKALEAHWIITSRS